MKEIGYLIKYIADKLKQNTEKELKKYDLTLSQSRVLIYLDSQGGEARQKEIQKFFRVTHPTIIGITERLENKGFVRTWLTLENKKEKVVGLTERAVFVVEDMERARNEREKLLKTGLTDKELEQLLYVLEKMKFNLDGPEEPKAIKKPIVKKKKVKEKDSFLWFL